MQSTEVTNWLAELVPLPQYVKPIGSKWVYKKKAEIPGVELSKFKTRLVA